MKHGLNRIFRVIWNEAIGAWVAVAECVRGHSKKSRRSALVLALGAVSAPVWAGPTGGTVVSGTASITNPTAGSTVINQTSNQTIINWSTFNIPNGQSVRFIQPGTTSVALNRVLGGNASEIMGSLSANGRVFLINPNGIIFGANSRVDVGGLVASSLPISDSDFLAGKLRFITKGTAGDVVNQGSLISANGGFVALIGKRVSNQGTITTPGGLAALASGSDVTLDLAPGADRPVAVEGKIDGATIESVGAIRAQDGRVVLSARAGSGDDALANIINHTGIIEARGLTSRGGRIVLEGGDRGVVSVSGKLDASSAAFAGGQVQVTGNAVVIKSGASVDVRGATGGGSATIGGNYVDADGAIRTAQVVDVESGSLIDASASQAGNGGTVVMASLRNTRFLGVAKATGGSASGNGGTVQVASNGTGYGVTDFGGTADVSAAAGAGGTVAIKARAIAVHSGERKADNRTLEQLINSTTTGGVSNVSTAAIESVTAGKVVVEADGYVVVRDLTENGGKGSIDLQRNVSLELYGKALLRAPTLPGAQSDTGGVYFNNPNNTINARGTGSITLTAGAPPAGAFNPKAGIYNVGNLNTEGGAITLNGADKVIIDGTLNSSGGKINIDADADRLGAGKLIMRGTLRSGGGDIRTNSGADAESGVDFLGTVDAGSGRLILDVSPTATPSNPASYANKYWLDGTIKAGGDIQFGQQLRVSGNSRIHTTGKVGFGGPVGFDSKAALTITAGLGGVQFGQAVTGAGGSLTLRPFDPAADIRLGSTGTGMDLSTVLAQTSGFASITVGLSDGTGRTLVSGTAALDGALNLLQGGSGGTVVFAPNTRLADRGADLGAAKSSLFVQAGKDVDFGTGTRIALGGGITAEAGNLVTLGSGSLLKTTGPNSKVVVSATTFVNPNGASGISAPRWLVYLPDPTQAAASGLTGDFKRYGCSYPVDCPTAIVPGSGNGFLYRIVPVLKVSSDGSTRVYGDGDPGSYTSTYSGFIDGDNAATAGLTGEAEHTLAGYTPTPSGNRGVGEYDVTHGAGTAASALGYRIEAGAVSKHTVTPKVLAAPTLNTQTREYDGTSAANSSAGPLGTFAGDSVGVKITGAKFSDKHAGIGKGVTADSALTGAEAGNYRLASDTVSGVGTITPKVIDGPSGATFTDRVYDGTRDAAGKLGSNTPSGLLAGDVVTVDIKQANFSDKNVGNNKDVAAELGLAGAAAGDYALRVSTVMGKASITPRIIEAPSVKFADKPFDGGTAATGAPAPFASGAVIAGDNLGAAVVAAKFNDPTVGNNKAVTGDLALTGIDAGNYRFTNRLGTIGVTGTAAIIPLDYEAGKNALYAGSSEGQTLAQTMGDAASRLIAGGMKLPPGVEAVPVSRVEK